MQYNIKFKFNEGLNFAFEPIEMFCKVIFDKYGKDDKAKLAVRLSKIKKEDEYYLAMAYYDSATSACYNVKNELSDKMKNLNQRFTESGNELSIIYGEKVIGRGKVV